MKVYLSMLDALKENFTTLIPFIKYVTTLAKQRNKFFMITTFVGLPPELDSICNPVLSGSIIYNY